MNKVLYLTDILQEVTSFLEFEDKIRFGKLINKNLCLNFNYNHLNHYSIYSIFSNIASDDDAYCEYLSDFLSRFTSDLNEYYDNYCGYDETDFMNDYYNNISIFRHSELTDLFYSTYIELYCRNILEYIENNNIKLEFWKYNIEELEEITDSYNIHTKIISYYQELFLLDFDGMFDLNYFCQRCGSFDHHSTSKKCIFWNENYENAIIYKNTNEIINSIVYKIMENEIQSETSNRCIICKNNMKKYSCIYSACRICCKIHTREQCKNNILFIYCKVHK